MKKENVNVKIKLLNANAFIPTKGTEKAAAFDLYVPEDTTVPKGRSVIKMGFSLELPSEYEADIDPRSGFSLKGIEGLTFFTKEVKRFNADIIHGLVDEDYRGEIGVIVINNDVPFVVPRGTRIAQMKIQKVEPVVFVKTSELSETERGNGGFGHTGAK